MQKKFLISLIFVQTLLNCVKAPVNEASAMGGSGLDGTGVFSTSGVGIGTVISVFYPHSTSAPAGSVAIPIDAKFLLCSITYSVNNSSTAPYPTTAAVKFNIKMVDTANSANVGFGFIKMVPRGTTPGSVFDSSPTVLFPIAGGNGLADLRGKNVGFFQDKTDSGVALSVSTDPLPQTIVKITPQAIIY